jgi:lysophospholipase L1-like esterase
MHPEWGTSRPSAAVFDPAVEHLAVVASGGRATVGRRAGTSLLKLVAVIAAATLASLSLAACKRDTRAHVVVIGDSLTHNALVPLYRELSFPRAGEAGGTYAVTFDAVPGRGVRTVRGVHDVVTYWDEHLRAAVRLHPDVYVIALGTNDCRYAGKAGPYGGAIDFMLSRLPGDKPVVWVNIPMPRRYGSCVAAADRAMVDARTRWPNLSVLDLRTPADASSANVRTDGIHLTAAGSALYARVLHAELDRVTR